MQTKPIKSVKDPDNENPWYSVEIDNGRPKILTDKDGGTGFDMSDTTAISPDWSDVDGPPASAMSTDAIYAVTESGEFLAYKPGTNLKVEHGISLRAHLAWYDSETDEFTVLEFVEL